jgi:hypothetical protein
MVEFVGFMPYVARPVDLTELDTLEPWQATPIQSDPRGTGQFPNVEDVCRLAGKLSRDQRGQYACLKLMMSLSDYSFHFMELHPRRGRVDFIRQSSAPIDHIQWARAIVGAYGAIEELGLEVRAAPSRPSLVNGSWNPAVLADLESRLDDRGIDRSDRAAWAVRGSRRVIQRKSAERLFTPQRMPWARGMVIRDIAVEVVDAINVASWLRSSVAAHRTHELRARLSPVEVHNVQHLARRLLLESFGFWAARPDRGRRRK